MPYIAFYLALFAGVLFAHLALYGYAYDDAYIHFRIAENLLETGKPYYNPGEAVMTSTSSGWSVTLFFLFFVFGANVKYVALLNAAVTTALAAVSSAIAGEVAGGRRPLQDAVVSMVCVSSVILPSVGMMETPMALLLAFAGALLYMRGRAVSFLFFGAAVFFRPELSLLLLLFFGYNLFSRGVSATGSFLYSALGAAPLLAYNYAFFGTNVPQAVAAKQVVFQAGRLEVLMNMLPRLFLAEPWGMFLESLFIAACIAV